MLTICGITTAQKSFVHPGLSHKKSDLDRMRYQVEAKIDPWYTSYQEMCTKSTASFDYTVQGNTSLHEVYRDAPRTNKNIFEDDSRAAYYNALRWYIEGDVRYAEKAVECLNAWTGLTYIQHNGTTGLTSNMIIIMLEAAELIKSTYSGWSASEIEAFEDMLLYPGYSDTTIPPNEGTEGTWYWRASKFEPVRAGNQELCAIRTTLALGVFLDDEKIYDRAKRYITKFPGRVDDIPFPTGPHVRGAETNSNIYRISYNMTVETTIPNFYGNGAITNYIYENGQCEESSRDQAHTSFGLGLLCSVGEIAWNQGDDLWANTNSRILLGLEYSLRYNVSFVNSYPDQLTEWTPTVASNEFLIRDDATLRTRSLSICPYIDNDPTTLTRGKFPQEDTWELPIAHYVGRGFKTEEETKWTIRARDYSIQANGRFETGPTGGAYVGFGGLSFRRPDGCYGDPINGFDSNGLPEYNMNVLPMTMEAENYDYSPVNGEGRTYSDTSTGNSGSVYRTDDVDVQTRTAGGYYIESMNSGEYLTYTIQVPGDGDYNISVNYSGMTGNGTLSVDIDGADVTGAVTLPATGGAQNWADFALASDINLTQGVQSMKITVGGTDGSFNLNSISVTLSEKLDQTIIFEKLPIRELGDDDVELIASVSSGLDISFSSSDTSVASIVNGHLQINGVGATTITATQAGNDVFKAASAIRIFQVNAAGSGLLVQAENYTINSGLSTETTTDVGGGQNVGNTNAGDYLQFSVNVPVTGTYLVDYRVASRTDGGSLSLLVGGSTVDNLSFGATGDWQAWETVSSYSEISLTEGLNTIRLNVDAPGWNLNWFELHYRTPSLSTNDIEISNIDIFPNPVLKELNISIDNTNLNNEDTSIILYTINGLKVIETKPNSNNVKLDLSHLNNGVYILMIKNESNNKVTKKIVKI